jgi:hypothetical protein
MMKKLFWVAAFAFGTATLPAEDSRPFQASLTPEVAIYPKTTEIRGLSLNIWGENPQQGVAIGLVNGSSGDSSGLTWALYNYAESYTGVSWGLANYSKTSFVGWQGGIFFFPCVVNIAKDQFTGFQQAAVNYAEDFHGLQLGLVNYSENLHGIQVGVVNIAMNNPWFKEFPDQLATGFPIVNWSF